MTASPTEQEIQRLRQWQRQGRHEEVVRDAEALLADLPENRDLLLTAAMSFRYLLRIDEALEILGALERFHPTYSWMLLERGLCLVQRHDAPGAINALLHAVNLNPAMPTAWSTLEGLYKLTGDAANAAIAAAHVATLKTLPPEVVVATSLISDGDFAPAEQIVRTFLETKGNHPEALRLLAKIAKASGILDDAEMLLAAVLQQVPNHRAARFDYAQTLVDRHKYREGREQIAQLQSLDPANPAYRELAATIAVGLGEQDNAIAAYRVMLVDFPKAHDAYLWLGHALKTVGRVPQAIEAYRRAAKTRPDFGDAYWSLANLKTYRFSEDELDRMRDKAAAERTGLADRYHLCFALGKGLEDVGEIEESWNWYERGNDLKRDESRYRPEVIETNTQKQIEVCTQGFFSERRGWGAPNPDPIFILGLPRSGSTLLEQILASHSQVEGTQELADIHRIVLELQGAEHDLDDPRYPGVLTGMSAAQFQVLGEKYLADTQVYRSGKLFFIDKMPNNFRHIGLIHLMLPNAKIIDARREAIACCFSNFKQLFAQGQEFTYSIQDIARYYRTYVELMDHWDSVLPKGRILRVQHEDVVEDLEGSVRRILDHCGLAFEPACIEFYKTERSVKTPSSEQVRQPIFRDGLDQWRKYEAFLGPLKTALGR